MRRKIKPSKKYHFLRGFVTIVLLMTLVVFGSIMLVGGLLPTMPEGTGEGQEAIIDTNTLPTGQHDNLQLGTFKFKPCAAISAVNFLVDNSGSMGNGSKMSDLKNGLRAFGASFPDEGIIGLQAYNQPGEISPEGYEELVPISKFADVKNTFSSAVDSMRPGGYTYSKSAMEFSKTKLQEAMPKFPEYKFNLIFISDGVPQTRATDGTCGYDRCFAHIQDPTSVATEIKAMGVRIFTLAYLDDSDARLNNELRNMMTNVASSPDDFYVAPVSNQIDQILAQIGQKVCN
jgi:hypothetical protein